MVLPCVTGLRLHVGANQTLDQPFVPLRPGSGQLLLQNGHGGRGGHGDGPRQSDGPDRLRSLQDAERERVTLTEEAYRRRETQGKRAITRAKQRPFLMYLYRNG